MSLQELNNRRAGGRDRGRGGSDTSAIFWLTSTTLNTEVHWAAIPSQLNGCAGIVWSVWAICSHHSGGLFGEERRGEDYTRLTQSSGAPGCHNNSLCFVTIITELSALTQTPLPDQGRQDTGGHLVFYCGEKVEEILNKVSGVMNIKVKHRDDQLYNFLISQPGGSLVSSATRQMNETYWSEGPRLD